MKVKLRVTSRAGTFDIGSGDTSAIRLLVRGNVGQWTAPWGNSQNAVFLTQLDPSKIYTDADPKIGPNDAWAIAPNPDGQAEPLDGSFTFATHWPASFELGPGQTYEDPGGKRGDLVFYVPEVGNGSDLQVLGIALFGSRQPGQDSRIVAFTRIDSWSGPDSDPNSF